MYEFLAIRISFSIRSQLAHRPARIISLSSLLVFRDNFARGLHVSIDFIFTINHNLYIMSMKEWLLLSGVFIVLAIVCIIGVFIYLQSL